MLAMTLPVLLFWSCKEDRFLPDEEINQVNSFAEREFEGDSLILDNPYTVDNMRDVFNVGGTQNPYTVYRDLNYNNYQNRTIANNNHYTSGGFDLIDNINQRAFYNNNAFPIDRVSGYSAVQLHNALIGSKGWNDWRDKIKSNYDNTTEQFVDELFANWTD